MALYRLRLRLLVCRRTIITSDAWSSAGRRCASASATPLTEYVFGPDGLCRCPAPASAPGEVEAYLRWRFPLLPPCGGVLQRLFVESGWLQTWPDASRAAPHREVVGRPKVLRYVLHALLEQPALWRDMAEELVQLAAEQVVAAAADDSPERSRSAVAALTERCGTAFLYQPPESLVFAGPTLRHKLLELFRSPALPREEKERWTPWDVFVVHHRQDTLLLPSPHLPPFTFGDVVHHLSPADFRVAQDARPAPHADPAPREEPPRLDELSKRWGEMTEAEQYRHLFGETGARVATSQQALIGDGVYAVTYGFDRDAHGRRYEDLEAQAAVEEKAAAPAAARAGDGEQGGSDGYALDEFYAGFIELPEPALTVVEETQGPTGHEAERHHLRCIPPHRGGAALPIFRRGRRSALPSPPSGWLRQQGLFASQLSGTVEDAQLSLLWQAFQGGAAEISLELLLSAPQRYTALRREVLAELMGQTSLLLLLYGRPEVRAVTPGPRLYAQLHFFHDMLLHLAAVALGMQQAAPPLVEVSAAAAYLLEKEQVFRGLPRSTQQTFSVVPPEGLHLHLVDLPLARDGDAEGSEPKPAPAAPAGLLPIQWSLPTAAECSTLKVYAADQHELRFRICFAATPPHGAASGTALVRLRAAVPLTGLQCTLLEEEGDSAATADLTVTLQGAVAPGKSTKQKVEAVPVKRGRGRPPKHAAAPPPLPPTAARRRDSPAASFRLPLTTPSSPSRALTHTPSAAAPAAKRGRGRPRKNTAAPLPEGDQLAPSRGPVVLPAATVGNTTAAPIRVAASGPTRSSAQGPGKRGRGRPRKIRADVVEAAAGRDRGATPAPKRGRGRPRKNPDTSPPSTNVSKKKALREHAMPVTVVRREKVGRAQHSKKGLPRQPGKGKRGRSN